MKKTYTAPETLIVNMETAGMLAVSQPFGGDATEPAQSPEVPELEEGLTLTPFSI